MTRKTFSIATMALVMAVVAAALPGAGASSARAAGFVQGTEDVPLMAGLSPVRGSTLEFAAPGGRIVESYARIAAGASADEVLAFYRATLPQLGWRPKGGQSFVRDGEALEIDFTGAPGDVTVRFSLTPR